MVSTSLTIPADALLLTRLTRLIASIGFYERPPASPPAKYGRTKGEWLASFLLSPTADPDDIDGPAEVEIDVEAAEETVCYANSLPVKIVGWVLWVIVVAANVYAIVSLGLGTAST